MPFALNTIPTTIVLPAQATVIDAIRILTTEFNKAELTFGHGFLDATVEAWALISHVLYLPFDNLDTRDLCLSARMTDDETKKIILLAERRINERIPMAYITGEAWLGGFCFPSAVGVIVPRSLLAEPLMNRLSPWLPDDFSCTKILELCCGSAALMVISAMAFPEALVVQGVDINKQALTLAEKTIKQYGMQNLISTFHGDLYEPIIKDIGSYDLIIANPPYVDDEGMIALTQEFLWEPKEALLGGGDGLDIVRQIVNGAGNMLSPNGFLLLEMGDHATDLLKGYPSLTPILLNNDSGEACVALFTAAELKSI